MIKIDEELAIKDALASFDVTSDENSRVKKPIGFTSASQKWREAQKSDIKKNKSLGHTAQLFDEIDAFRKTPEGKQARNLKRKQARELKALSEGRVIKPRRTFANDEERQKAAQKTNTKAQETHRSKVPVASQSAARQDRRKRAKERKKQALIDNAIA